MAHGGVVVRGRRWRRRRVAGVRVRGRRGLVRGVRIPRRRGVAFVPSVRRLLSGGGTSHRGMFVRRRGCFGPALRGHRARVLLRSMAGVRRRTGRRAGGW
jgi:hypothetical protein